MWSGLMNDLAISRPATNKSIVEAKNWGLFEFFEEYGNGFINNTAFVEMLYKDMTQD